jgi:hypothetical protein
MHVKFVNTYANSNRVFDNIVISPVGRLCMLQEVLYIAKLLVALWADEAICPALPSMLQEVVHRREAPPAIRADQALLFLHRGKTFASQLVKVTS